MRIAGTMVFRFMGMGIMVDHFPRAFTRKSKRQQGDPWIFTLPRPGHIQDPDPVLLQPGPQ